jgi:hypothetical protein
MSETKPIYDVDTTPVDVRCLICNQPLGAVIHHIHGAAVLCTGNMVLDRAHGVCMHCGSGFHFEIGERALAHLIQRVIDLRGDGSGV